MVTETEPPMSPTAAAAATVAGFDWLEEEKHVVRWDTTLCIGTWHVQTLKGEQVQRDVSSDVGAAKLALVAVQECRWDGTELATPMGAYVCTAAGLGETLTGSPTAGCSLGFTSAGAEPS